MSPTAAGAPRRLTASRRRRSASAAPQSDPSGPGRALAVATRRATTALLLGAGLLFAVLAVGPHLLGYRTHTMLSGSMSPAIRAGDVVVETAEPLTGVRVGQVITFDMPTGDHRVLTHRVVQVRPSPTGVSVRTKGDRNAQPDAWTAQLPGQQVWRVRAVVPCLGRLIVWLRAPSLSALLRGSLALFVLDALAAIWRRPRHLVEGPAS